MTKQLLAFASLCALTLARAEAHSHLYVGVVTLPDSSKQISIVDGTVQGSGNPYRLTLMPLTPGLTTGYGGYYTLASPAADNFTLAVLGTGEGGLLSPPAPNSDIWAEIVSVTGPAGGHLGFWEGTLSPNDPARSTVANTPTQSFTTGALTGGFAFELTELVAGDSDPGGHIHGRGWTADLPGNYEVTMRLVDRGTSGVSQAPQTYTFGFTTVVPEPGAMSFGALGLLTLFLRRRR